MKFIKILCLLFILSTGYAQNYEICYPFDAYNFCTAKYICDDEYYDGFSDFCPTYAPGENDNFQTILVYEFTVDQANQLIDITVGGDWDFEKMSLNLVGPLDLTTGCQNPEMLGGATNYIDTTSAASILDLPLIDHGTYFITLSSGGYKGTSSPPYVEILFSPEKDCVTEVDQCESCIGSFAPVPQGQVLSNGQVSTGKYLIGAWAKEPDLYTATGTTTKTSYDQPEIKIHFYDASGTLISTAGPFKPSGAIIDTWQRIEEEFTIPATATEIKIELTTVDDNVLFDDVRMFPFDASMKTFVYDPINMRLAAELDERHYATFYEYDEEGKLVRIKKETEKGIMTIQETKSNASK